MNRLLITMLLVGFSWVGSVQAEPYKSNDLPPFELIEAAIVKVNGDSAYTGFTVKRKVLGYTGGDSLYTIYYTKPNSEDVLHVTLARLNTGLWILYGKPSVIVQEN